MLLLRRWLLLWLLMFWLGGFTFYAAVVVPVGTEVLGSLQQGSITRQVTNWLNLAGAVALAAWALEIALGPAPTRPGQTLRWLLWLAMALLLVVLVLLHPRMDALLDAAILDQETFGNLHRWYLWLSTVQWGAGLLLSFSTLRTWRDADRRQQEDGTQPLGPFGA